MKILLTGGTGFFGKALIRFWLNQESKNRPDSVTVFSRRADTFKATHPEFKSSSWLNTHAGDILNLNTLPQDDDFTHVIHAATDSTHVKDQTAIVRHRQIVDGTKNLLEYTAKKKINRFLYISSGAVYGHAPKGMAQISEEFDGSPDPLDERNVYGASKRSAEHLCALYGNQYEFEWLIARCFAFVGPDLPLDVHFAIGNFLRDAIHKIPIVIKGDGTPIRSYMDQRDLAHWLSELLLKGRPGHAYNVGSDQGISIIDLATLINNIISPTNQIIVLSNKNTHEKHAVYVPSIEKIKNHLAVKLNFTLPESISHAQYQIERLIQQSK